MPEKTAAITYFNDAIARLEALRNTQTGVIQRAADLCADRISKGGLVFLFGNGHSRMMCEEMTPRQGCFVGFFALVELALSNHASIIGANGLRAPLHLEKFEGYAAWKWSSLLGPDILSNLSASHPYKNRPPLIGN